MTHSDEITKAIGAHGKWKRRLQAVIEEGRSDVPPERVEPDNLCDFGRWLYSLSPADQNSEYFRKVQSMHASFHREAAKVLRLALSGQKAAAEKCMAFGGPFANASADLTITMMDWKKAVGG